MMSLVGAGSLVGALVLAHRSRPGLKLLGVSAMALGGFSILLAWTPSLEFAALALFALGIASIAFMVTGNSTLQLRSAPSMRGRVMALFSVVFLGSTPIGAPIAGFLAQSFGPRAAFTVAGAVAIVAGGIALRLVAKGLDREEPAVEETSAPVSEPGDASGPQRLSA
jgi:MFS family permease